MTSGDTVFFHGLAEADEKRLRRLVIAYDGDVCAKLSAQTTHVVTPAGFDLTSSSELQEKQAQLGFQIVDVTWVDGKVQGV